MSKIIDKAEIEPSDDESEEDACRTERLGDREPGELETEVERRRSEKGGGGAKDQIEGGKANRVVD